MTRPHSEREAGFTFAELAMAMVVMVISAVVLINHLSVNYQTTATERDRVFAFSKAQAILAEIQTYVDNGSIEAAVDLDVLDDGITTKNALTIQVDPDTAATVLPDHVVSGNYQRGGEWVWARRISVQPFSGLDNRNVRYVTVRVFKRDGNGNEHAMADLSAVINSASNAYPTTQVFDVYLLAVENIPGWWVFMDSIKPFVESMITDLENRNPGMSFRTHWITKAAFGRNQLYQPHINSEVDSYEVISDVYHYPGRMPDGNASGYYYVPDNFKARMDVDDVEMHGYDGDLNPHPYALADYFNHAMRYPDELALWQARVDAIEAREQEIADAIAVGDPKPEELDDMSKEPTLRLFLEDLATDSEKYRNALIINLHGELLPMPALRNYSDAAKDPQKHAEWRVVTHPEELRTKNNDGGTTDSVKLRMYAYKSGYGNVADTIMNDPMVVEIVGVDLTDSSDHTRLDSNVVLQNVPGGVTVSGSNLYASSWQNAKHVSDTPATNEMYYLAEYVDEVASSGNPFTRVYLFNTPLVAPLDTANRGLAATERARLYMMEYVPCPVGSTNDFVTDLTTVGASGPKNTARWRLELKPGVLTSSMFRETDGHSYDPTGDVLLQVRTRIASDYGSSDDWKQSGTVFPTPIQPDNLSTTYAWWTDSKDDVPITERAQFNGDPRHEPYKDCFSGGDDFPNAYNWYHDTLANGGENSVGDYVGINGARLRNRWGGAMSCDVPRYFELLRTGVVESATVYTTLTGFSYYYLGIGNDIGYDAANGYTNSIPSNMVPHGTTGNGYIDTITGARRWLLSYVGAYSASGYWVGYPWLGELYPDRGVDEWLDTVSGTEPPRGNLTAGTGTYDYFQWGMNVAYQVGGRTAYGTTIYDAGQRTSTNGCSTFFNIGTNTSAFRHSSSSGNGTLTSTGQEIGDNYSMTMPATTPISRPFSLTASGAGGDQWLYAPYSTRYTGSLYKTYFTHSAGTGSGVVKLVNPGGTSAGYVVVNGIDKAVESGTTFIAKWAVLTLAHTFFEAGSTSNTLRIPQLARVEIESPTTITELMNPDEIEVLFGIEWTRWDGLDYSETGTFSEDESQLRYRILYSPDNGATWRYVQDDSETRIGQAPDDPLVTLSDAGAGQESFTWSTPSAAFPAGSYLLRVECYRDGAQVHYSWHQNRIYIQR
ncbi:MAG: hypothetical protein H6835_03485 [Planctomycetes bacterium]|nr:hypothetical protein [Planctomycetota bacterium]